MLKLLARTLSVSLVVCAAAAHAETPSGETTSRMQPSPAPRLAPAELNQVRATRAEREARSRRHSLSNIRMSPRGAAPGPNPRLAHTDLQAGARSTVTVSPHATDPGAPRQAMTRSAERDMRAPSSPSPERGDPNLAPRMSAAEDLRKSRATFEDWLFGR
ncbi:hypothetical protein [Methyloceanibacter sp. wino2]|uniref:hypothetical protein n=1 Tax=Methyloceanibacter sp. wino2 TaxID=2170729 RepID=UPI00131F3152|nr:hypothetical protein [Methyloceanibacter sp. wino2]